MPQTEPPGSPPSHANLSPPSSPARNPNSSASPSPPRPNCLLSLASSPSSQESESSPPRKKQKSWQVFSNEHSRTTLWRREHRNLVDYAPRDNEVGNDPNWDYGNRDDGPDLENNNLDSDGSSVISTARARDINESGFGLSDNSASQDSDISNSEELSESSDNQVSDDEITCGGADDADMHSSDESRHSDSGSETESEDELELYDGCEFSVDEAVLDIMTDCIKNCESKQSLKAHLKTFLKYIPKINNMPKTSDLLLKYVEQLVPAYREITYSFCSGCLFYLEDDNACRACMGTGVKHFYMYCLEEQLRYYFEECNLAEVLESSANRQSTDGKIRDILDGTEYLRAKVEGDYNLTLLMNTDGVSIRNSSSTQIWPVMFTICEVPIHQRQRFLIMCGIWCDAKEPPMSTLLRPVVDTISGIERKGGVAWTHRETNVVHKSIVTVPVLCVDAPVRAKIQNILSHSGNQGCNTCEQKMEKIPLTAEERRAKAAGQKVRCKRGYIFQHVPAIRRTDYRMRQQAREVFVTRRKDVEGVKGPSIVGRLPRLDISTCVYAEYMHAVCLGVVKTFLTLWLTVPGHWNIGGRKEELDEQMKKIRPPDIISRLPRGVSDFKYWKASELRHWLLFYSIPCLSGILPEEYFQHWTLLVISIHMVLQEEISLEDLQQVEEMLKIFVRDVGRLYRQRDNVYNVHQLLHLTLYIKWWGPPFNNSAFLFESCNGNLVNLIHGTKNPGKELMRNVRIAHGVEVLKHKVLGTNPQHPQRANVTPLNVCKYPNIQEDEELLRRNDFSASAVIYSRVKRRREVFSSKMYTREKKRCNHTIRFKSRNVSCYGDIKYFILHDDEVYAVVEKFRLNHAAVYLNDALGVSVRHILPIEDLPMTTTVIKMSDVLMKVIKVGSNVCILPNTYEKNL